MCYLLQCHLAGRSTLAYEKVPHLQEHLPRQLSIQGAFRPKRAPKANTYYRNISVCAVVLYFVCFFSGAR